jgi:hypothetical protein
MSFRSILNSSGWLRNTLLIRRSKDDEVHAFMRMARPHATEHPLIRIGGEGDGGYLVPDDLVGISALFSPGVAETADFEAEFARRNVPCFLADYSVEGPPVSSQFFYFEKKYLGTQTKGITMTLDDWVTRLAPAGDDLMLQMDIEGAEYGVLLSADQATLRRFRIIVLELHGLQQLWQPKGLELVSLMFTKLLTYFDVVHAHPNNCLPPQGYGDLLVPPVLEVTLLRKDRSHTRKPIESLPHSLDRTNVPNLPDFSLPACWYK